MFLLQGLLSYLPGTHASLLDNWKADRGRTARTWLHVLISRGFKNLVCFSSLPPSPINKNKLLQKYDAHQVRKKEMLPEFICWKLTSYTIFNPLINN